MRKIELDKIVDKSWKEAIKGTSFETTSQPQGPPMKMGELLALCRELKGLSLRDVQKETGLSNPFISQIETGKFGPSFKNAVLLCDFYGLSLDRLADTIRNQIQEPPNE